MSNPFAIEPANPLAALMMGVQGYDRAQKAAKEAAIQAARKEAGDLYAQGGDTKGVFGKLLGLGDADTIKALASMGPKDTDDMREYQKAVSQGYNGNFMQYQTAIKGAGATKIHNVVNSGETAFAKEAGQVQAKRFSDLAAQGPKANQMISDLDTLRDLGGKIGTGKEAEIKAVLGPWAKAAGIDVDGLPEIQAYEAVVARAAPNFRIPGTGAQSDYEAKQFIKQLPTLGNTPEGNEILTRTVQGAQRNQLMAAEIGSKALNGEITRPQAEKMLRELPDPMKDWREFNKRGGKPATPAPRPTATPPGMPTGARQGSDGKFYIPDPQRPGKYLMVQP